MQQAPGDGEDGDEAGLLPLTDRGGLAFTGAPAPTTWLALLGLVLLAVGTAVAAHRRRDPVVVTR